VDHFIDKGIEGIKMKLTKRQLMRIIKESIITEEVDEDVWNTVIDKVMPEIEERLKSLEDSTEKIDDLDDDIDDIKEKQEEFEEEIEDIDAGSGGDDDFEDEEED